MPSQAIFVAEKAAGRSGAEAARRAGYSPRTARYQASRLATKVNDEIETKSLEYVQRVEEHAIWTKATVLQELRATYDAAFADGKWGPAAKCLDLVGRHLKMWDAETTTNNVLVLQQFLATVKELPTEMMAAALAETEAQG